jgi:hypothetical protein
VQAEFSEKRKKSGVSWAMHFGVTKASVTHRRYFGSRLLHRPFAAILVFALLAATQLFASRKDKVSYGEGLIINIPLPEPEVEQVVADVAQNGIIRGTKEYNKDQFVSGAIGDDSSDVFPVWSEGGKVFYKVRMHAIDPANFKDTNDVGTLVVRYVVQPQGEKNTLLHIDAMFQEDFRKISHASNGTVESEEYKDIREHLESIELMKRQNVEALGRRQQILAAKQNQASPNQAQSGNGAPAPQSSSRAEIENDAENVQAANTATPLAADPPSDATPVAAVTGSTDASSSGGAPPGQTLEQRLQDLRKQVERKVKSPGAPLKTAPFHTASTLVLLNPGAEVLIVINTPYWYGVETHDGQHGWIMRDQLDVP